MTTTPTTAEFIAERDRLTAETDAADDDLTINEFRLAESGSHGRPLHFTTDESDVYPKRQHLGESAGTIMVRVGVDLDHDLVAMDQDRCSQLALLDTVIRDLQQVRDTLAGLTPAAAEGRCMNGEDWGRCLRPDGHDGDCEGPTEAQWRASQDVLTGVRARRVAAS